MNQKQIAQLAHVSPSTVSKALRNNRVVAPELAERIRQIAMENGYIQEKSERKLSNLRSKRAVIAVFCPELISIWYTAMVSRLKREIEAQDGDAIVCVYDFSQDKLEQQIQSFALRGVCDAIIVIGNLRPGEDAYLPTVCFAGSNRTDATGSVCSELETAMELAIAHLVSLGHTSIGYMGEKLTYTKEEMFCRLMQKHHLFFNSRYVFVSDQRFDAAGYDCANLMLKQPTRPTAIIAAYDEIALGAIHTATAHGIRVPQELSVVGINNIPFSAYAGVGLTTVDMFPSEIEPQAVKNLFSKIFDGKKTIENIVSAPRLIVRQSTAPCMPPQTN